VEVTAFKLITQINQNQKYQRKK